MIRISWPVIAMLSNGGVSHCRKHDWDHLSEELRIQSLQTVPGTAAEVSGRQCDPEFAASTSRAVYIDSCTMRHGDGAHQAKARSAA